MVAVAKDEAGCHAGLSRKIYAAGVDGEAGEESTVEGQGTGMVALMAWRVVVVAALVAVQAQDPVAGTVVRWRVVVVEVFVAARVVAILSGGFSTRWCAAASFRSLTIPNASCLR